MDIILKLVRSIMGNKLKLIMNSLLPIMDLDIIGYYEPTITVMMNPLLL